MTDNPKDRAAISIGIGGLATIAIWALFDFPDWVLLIAIAFVVLWRVSDAVFHDAEEDCPRCGAWLGDPQWWPDADGEPLYYGGENYPISCPACSALISNPELAER